MSFILDALSRADRERDVQPQVPTLNSGGHPPAPMAADATAGRGWHLERWLIVVVLLGLLLLELSDRIRPAETSEPVVSVAREPELPVRASTEDAVERSIPVRQKSAVPRPEPHSETVRPVNRQAIASLYEAPPEALEETASSQRSGDSAPRPTAAADAVNASPRVAPSDYQHVPYITELPQELRKQIPSLDYAEHFPSAEPGGGRVMVNGALRGVGEQIEPELVLVAIEHDGIIMSFRGSNFRLPALNRWINF